MTELQFTPETAKGLLNLVANPDVTPTTFTGKSIEAIIFQAAQKKFSAGQAEESLKVISGEVIPYTDKDIERVLLWNLSSNRDANTQNKKDPSIPEEQKRFSDSKIMVEAVRSFLENGKITPTLRGPIVTFLTNNSQLAGDLIKDMKARQDVYAFVDSLLESPGFREQLRTLFIERLNPDRRLTKENTVINLELEIAKLSAQLGTEVTQKQIDDARHELEEAESKLEADPTELLKYKSETARYQELTDDMSNIKRTLKDNEAEGKQYEDQITDLLTKKNGLDLTNDAAKITQIEAEIKKIQSKPAYARYINAKEAIREHQDLEKSIANLQTKLGPLQKEVAKKQEALNSLLERQKSNITFQRRAEIEAEINQKKVLLADAKTELEAEMIRFSRDVTHMGQDAMEKYLNGVFSKLKEIWKTEAAAQAEKDKTENGKLAALAADKVAILWKIKKTKRGLTFYEGDKNKIKLILNEAFKPGGAENVAKYMEGKNAQELGLTNEEYTALMDKLKNDPDFRKTQSEGWAKQALADYLIAGGKLNQTLVENIATSDFGKALITDSRAKVDAALQQFKDQLGKKGIETNLKTFLKEKWWLFGIPLVILLILLGISLRN